MRILAIEREIPLPARPDLREILREEAAGVWALQKRGFIRDIWFTAADRHAIVMLECADVDEARQLLATLPLVRTGLIEFTLHELRSYDGFERLFGPATSAPPPALKQDEPPEY
jgi:muconolactone delta-isomerase